jgi:hypothetical protein
MGGIKAARGRYVIMGDADDSYDFLNLGPFLERLQAGDDLVMGNRFKGGIQPGAMPFLHKYLGNPVLSFLGRLFYRVPIHDFHCGLRGFSREAILGLGLASPGMEFASEMIVKAGLRHLKLSEVPTTLSPDGRSRAPHLKTWRDGWRNLRFLLLHNPRWLFFYPGLTLLLMGLVGVAELLPGPVHLGGVELDFNTLLMADFAVLVGVQLTCFAIVARRFAAAEGILPPIWNVPRLIEGMGLERLLLVALAAFILGAGGVFWSIWHWASVGFGPIVYSGVTRYLSVSLMLITLSIQLAASAFLASVFELRRQG